MYFWRVLAAMIKPKNWGLLLYVLASMGLAFGLGFGVTGLFVGGYEINHATGIGGVLDMKLFVGLMMVAANFVLSILLASDLGELFYRILLFNKALVRYNPKKQNYEEYENIYRIFQRVHERAREKSKLIPKNVRLYICHDGDANACIIGVRTLVIHDGLLDLSDEQIEGIIAHEFGHIANSDAVLPMCKISANSILTISVGIIIGFLKLAAFISLFTEDSDRAAARIFGFIMKWLFAVIISWILKLALQIWFSIGFLFEMIASRKQEYAADKFAYKIGYGEGLADALHSLDGSIKRRTNIFDGMTRTHPYTMDRVDKLNELIKNEGSSTFARPEPVI